MTLFSATWRNGRGHAESTGSHSIRAGWEKYREKVISDLVGNDKRISQL